jgi:hypothetical protein
MIQDFTNDILRWSTEYTRITVEKFGYNGTTYPGNSVTTTIRGILQPLTSEDRLELLGLGHTIAGKKVFYAPSSEGILTENDTIVDLNNVEWAVLPDISDWSEQAGYVKYRLERRVL